MRSIFVTGCEGFIGQHLMKLLTPTTPFTGIDIKVNTSIFDDTTEAAVQEHDVVIHLAALTSVSESFEKPDEYMHVNVEGTKRIVDLCNKYGKKLIYVSSAAVFDPESSPYAKSKAEAEKYVKRSVGQNTSATILRLFNVYSKSKIQKPGSVMDHFLYDDPIYINGGDQYRTWICLDDVCNIIADAARYNWKGAIIDVGVEMAKVKDLAETFSVFRKVPTVFGPKVQEVGDSLVSIQPLRKYYQGPLQTNLGKDIRQMVKEAHG